MRCPVDQVELNMTDRQGIEIDYCPQCRGVWLDRGELDKIIERSADTTGASSKRPENSQSSYREPQQYERPRNEYSEDHQKGYKKRKKEGFLGDLFDF